MLWVKIYRDSAITSCVNSQRLRIIKGDGVKMGSWRKEADKVDDEMRRKEQARGQNVLVLALTFHGVWTLNYLQTTAVE